MNIDRPPTIHASRPGDELRAPHVIGFTRPVGAPKVPGVLHQTARASVPHPSQSTALSNHELPAEARRFHLARANTPLSPRELGGGVKRKGNAIFVERTRPPTAKKVMTPEKKSIDLPNTTSALSSTPESQIPPPLLNVRQASGTVFSWDTSQDDLTAAAQAYTLAAIERDVAEADEAQKQRLPSPFVPRKVSSRFKPRTPAKRYHERYPGDASAGDKLQVQQQEKDEVMVDEPEQDDDESDYIIDTFVRVPVESLELQAQYQNIGLLVLDSQPDIDEFYNEDSDDESEIYDEEEDENGRSRHVTESESTHIIAAENHPSTDYPDEEVDSDDEFGRNAYRYRTRNASDDEEFDEDEATFSEDDDVVGSTKPWSRKPPWMRPAANMVDGDEE